MLIQIFTTVILPIFLIIAVGVVLDRRFSLDLPTLSRLNFYAFVPALAFVKLLQADISPGLMASVGIFNLAHTLLLFLISIAVFSLPAVRRHATVLTLGTIFYNAGNYGIPLVLLAFGDSMIGVITVVIVLQNLLSFTFGVWLLERKRRETRQVLLGLLQMPIIYAVIGALALRFVRAATGWQLPAQIMSPLNYLSDGLIPLALLTLGVQLARTQLTHRLLTLSAITLMRLAVSPLLAAGLLLFFHFHGQVSSVLVVSAGCPVAVNVYILTSEYRHDEDLDAQAILISTLLSGITISLLLTLFR